MTKVIEAFKRREARLVRMALRGLEQRAPVSDASQEAYKHNAGQRLVELMWARMLLEGRIDENGFEFRQEADEQAARAGQ